MGTGAANAGQADNAEDQALYGNLAGHPIPGVAQEVSDIYSQTITSLYNAGADAETADKYAKQVAQTLADSKLAVVDLQFPDYYGESAEKSLFSAQLTGASPAKMLGAKALSALPSSRGRKAITH
jgi:hypothetical protein